MSVAQSKSVLAAGRDTMVPSHGILSSDAALCMRSHGLFV